MGTGSRSLIWVAAAAMLVLGCDRASEPSAVAPAQGGREPTGEGFFSRLFPGLSQMNELEERARLFWKARVAGDLLTTYEYEDAKPLGTMSLQSYVSGRGGLHYKRADVRHAECGRPEEGCIVHVDVEYVLPALAGKPISAAVNDSWVSINGQWYHQAKRGNPLRNHQPKQ